jgi:hypothetical protein
MRGTERKAAIAAYKERKVAAGIYALACAATGQRWVGRAPDLAKIENRIRFTLAHDAALRPSLKAAVGRHGADAIGFEVLESVGEDDLPYARDRFLKDRQEHWREKLGAEAI